MKKLSRASAFVLVMFTISTMLTGCDGAQIGQVADQIIQVVVQTIQAIRGIGGGGGGNVNPPAGNPPAGNPPAPVPPPQNPAAPTGGAIAGAVTVYSTNSCPFCTQAKAYLQSKGIAFVEKNVENDPAAKREMEDKARAAGLPTGGVPKIDVAGTLIHGFDRAKLDRALKEKTTPAGTQTQAPPTPPPPATNPAPNNAPLPNPGNDGGPNMMVDPSVGAVDGGTEANTPGD